MRIVKKIKKKINKKTKNIKVGINIDDKNKVWAFCSGQYSNDFRGNPKYLFKYINEHRKDIYAYWLCSNDEVIKEVRGLGYNAFKIGTLEAEYAINKTGVLVAEQVKISIPKGLENVKYLNLWHGVGGVKNVERAINQGILIEELAKKYILRNDFYISNQLYLAPSKKIENIAIEQLGINKKQIIRAGYPRCMYKKENTKLPYLKDLPNNTKVVCYAPTYRNDSKEEIFLNAIPDMDKLIKICEKEHLFMIFKMHPLIENETSFLRLKEKYKTCKWLLFWDNKNDFYEIINKVDVCIYDYSSIFTDFIAVGTKYFIRYMFDFDSNDLEFVSDYENVTVGTKCKTFNSLLNILSKIDNKDYLEKIDEIKKMYWEYASENSFENIIDATINYKIQKLKLPTLYSFDVFDTIISRNCLEPTGIFLYVKQNMEKSDTHFPKYLIDEFPKIRKDAELNIREYYNRTINERNDIRCEIQFDEIYARIKSIYNLNDKQVEKIKEWEIEAELENVYPLNNQIDKIKELIRKNEKVVLISDMYLPKEIIKKMLKKADPILETLDLYLSSESGYQKSRKTLYLEVYKKYGENYKFKNWIHTGDNLGADIKKAKELNIETRITPKVNFNNYEKALVNTINTYDAYLIAANIARFRNEHTNLKEYFTYSYISLLFVPYIRWALNDAKKENDEIVYFVSRDGHHLKRIGDVVNEIDNLNLELEYFYASRKTWRIPSFIDNIDIDFWGMGHGNFVDIKSFKQLLKALNLSKTEFRNIFPELSEIDEHTKFNPKKLSELATIFQNSSEYNEILLEKAKIQRKTVCAYLEQTLNKSKKFSIVEYWGRGYTQENFTRLWHYILKKEVPVSFYYTRSTLPSTGYNIRKNYTTNPKAQQFIESIFACINYKSIENYEFDGKEWKPIIKENTCDLELFKSMENLLPLFAKEYCCLNLMDSNGTGRALIDFAINYYYNHPEWECFTNVLAKLKDSVQLYGDVEEFAPAINKEHIKRLKDDRIKYSEITKNVKLSLLRTSDLTIKNEFYNLFQINSENETLNKKLSLKDLQKDKKNKMKIKIISAISTKLNLLYLEQCKKKVDNKITILTYGIKNYDSELISLIETLKSQNYFKYEIINLLKSPLKKTAISLATSKYIIMKKPYSLISKVEFGNNNKIIILSETVLYYFKKGLSIKKDIKSLETLEKIKYNIKPNLLQVPTNEVFKNYKNIFNLNGDLEVIENGSAITDIYFNKNVKDQLLKKLYRKFPNAKHKKIIFYGPYNRFRNKKAKYFQLLDMELLYKNLKDDYVVIINFNQSYYNNKLEINNFSKNLTYDFSVREMMLMSDIIISDYRNTTFEAPLLNIPIFMSSWDLSEIDSKTNTLFSLSENKYGVEISDTSDFIDKLANIDKYNYENSKYFKNKYLSMCDGHSAQRLIKYLEEKCNEKE